MFKNPFKKKLKGLPMEALMGIAKSFGFDPGDWLSKQVPQWLHAALQLEHAAGNRLCATLSISDDSTHFVAAVYRVAPDGTSTLWNSYALTNPAGLIDQLKTMLTLAQQETEDDDTNEHSIAQLPAATVTNGDAGPEHGNGGQHQLSGAGSGAVSEAGADHAGAADS